MAVLPAKRGVTDLKFDNRRAGVSISMISYAYNGGLADQVEEMVDYYGDAINIEQEEARVLGDDGFVATITRGDDTTTVKISKVFHFPMRLPDLWTARIGRKSWHHRQKRRCRE